jgi:hypothetical protein
VPPFGLAASGFTPRGRAGKDLEFVSPQGAVLWRRNLIPTAGLSGYGGPDYSEDGRTIYVWGRHADGRSGVWAIPVTGSSLRLVVDFDAPT